MKKIILIAMVFAVLALTVPCSPAVSQAQEETRITGVLHLDSMSKSGQVYWVTLDKPIIFAPGSKSERVVRDVKLVMPADLQEKAKKLDGKHVVAVGPMECTMSYTPWTASCEMLVKQIDLAK